MPAIRASAASAAPNARCAADYQARLSGPLLDRIDLHIEVPAVTAADLILPPPSEGSAEVAARVARGARRPGARATPRSTCRACAPMRACRRRCWKRWPSPTPPASTLLRDAADAMRLSARGYHRVLRVARTLADLDGAEKVGRIHLAEALSYRALADEVRAAA